MLFGLLTFSRETKNRTEKCCQSLLINPKSLFTSVAHQTLAHKKCYHSNGSTQRRFYVLEKYVFRDN
jgi:hypothetical protein